MFYGVSNDMWWQRRQMHAVWRSRTNMNVNRKEIHVEKCRNWKLQMWGRELQTGGREKSSSTAAPSALSRVLSMAKVWDHVLTIPIMCTVVHFQCNFLPQSAIEEKFPGYRPFVLPTLFPRGAGNLTTLDPTPPPEVHAGILYFDNNIQLLKSLCPGCLGKTNSISSKVHEGWKLVRCKKEFV